MALEVKKEKNIYIYSLWMIMKTIDFVNSIATINLAMVKSQNGGK